MAVKSDGLIRRMMDALEALASADWAASALPIADAFMRTQLASGLTPDGEPWPPTKKGKMPLKGAAAALKIVKTGRGVVMKIGGGDRSRYAYHHFGAQLKPARRQLPRGKLPERLGDALRAGLGLEFKAITKAGKRGFRYYKNKGAAPNKAGK